MYITHNIERKQSEVICAGSAEEWSNCTTGRWGGMSRDRSAQAEPRKPAKSAPVNI
jgi:hypothetical protein